MKTSEVICGDCLIEMAKMSENSIDAIVTDPPYGLSFMGKDWDHGIPGTHFWQEALRVSKPGAHMLAFGGTRTHHRLMVAIEDAGWGIRDCLMWIYGSGFPKSLDISKAIDKQSGVEREVIGIAAGMGKQNPEWNGTAKGRKENSFKPEYELTLPSTGAAKQWNGWGTALKPAWEPIILCRKPVEGTIAENILKWGVGGINIDACRVLASEKDQQLMEQGRLSNRTIRAGEVAKGYGMKPEGLRLTTQSTLGRFPANFIHDGSQDVLDLFPDTGKSTGGRTIKRSGGGNVGSGKKSEKEWSNDDPGYGDFGSAARFFYCAKASRAERNIGLEDPATQIKEEKKNAHPTVKPLELMRYLCRLITPPNGMILDPFGGSGSTGIAAMKEGFNSILIEIEQESVDIARLRIAGATKP
jgi:DNA modification methylase